ncbi:MAG: response regulator [Gemmatimonadales bacterium]
MSEVKPPPERPTVLFVDDDAMVCRSISRLLDRIGFSVTPICSAEEALGIVAGTRFDAIVTDHNMPTMSGAELIDRLLAIDPSLAPRIILTSGDLHTQANDELIKRTGIRGLQKPFQAAELALVLRAATAPGSLSAA